jgi:uncharacterized damage-inducible protein DinB
VPHEVDRAADQVRRAAEGHAWSGPSAREALDSVTAEMAAAHPISGAHSIWELVRHMTVWANAARRRLAGEIVEPTPDEDYPPTDGLQPADWDRDCRALYAAHQSLATAIAALDDSALDRALESASDGAFSPNYTIYITAHGLAQHTLYHTGQIMLLKRALQPARAPARPAT